MWILDRDVVPAAHLLDFHLAGAFFYLAVFMKRCPNFCEITLLMTLVEISQWTQDVHGEEEIDTHRWDL